jgi:hypothetical protein
VVSIYQTGLSYIPEDIAVFILSSELTAWVSACLFQIHCQFCRIRQKCGCGWVAASSVSGCALWVAVNYTQIPCEIGRSLFVC